MKRRDRRERPEWLGPRAILGLKVQLGRSDPRVMFGPHRFDSQFSLPGGIAQLGQSVLELIAAV